MNIYVAGKWEDKRQVREVISALCAGGHHITHDWTQEAAEAPYYQVPMTDIRAIERADCLVMVLLEDLGYVGSWVELGAALAYGRPVYIMAGDWLLSQRSHAKDPTKWRNVFLWHPLVRPWSEFPAAVAVQMHLF